MASVIWVGKRPDHSTPTEMAVDEASDRTSSRGKRASVKRLVKGVSLQSGRYSTHALSKRTLSVRTSKTLRVFGALAVIAGSRGARRTAGRPPAPVPSDAKANTRAAPDIESRVKRPGLPLVKALLMKRRRRV